MPFVSVTRLHLKSFLSYPMFIYYAMASAKQARKAPGFIAGWLGGEDARGNWTATVWETAEAMRAFRNSGPHLKVMPKLMHWCDESSFAHWEQADATVPTGDVAYERMISDGKLSKVRTPSQRHSAGRTAGDLKPKAGLRLAP